MARIARTRNHMGWVSVRLGPPSELFVEHCRTARGPVLDLGCAYGAAALGALAAGADLIANDLDPAHLGELARRAGPDRPFTARPGRFPEIEFDEASLAAVHASNLFHFLSPRRLRRGFAAIARWLAPGGKLFVQTSTPHQPPFAAFAAEYERRVEAGVEWPGWIEKISEWSGHRQLGQMPRAVHLLTDAVLRREAEAAGLRVERAWMYQRDDLPRELRLDGRECAGLVAVAGLTHADA